MSRKRRFEVLLRVAEAREQDAARALADGRTALQESHDKLEQLLLYRADYGKDLTNQGRVGLGVQIQNHWLFLERLNSAITEQRQELHQLGHALEATKRRWQDTHRQLSVLGRFAERVREADRTENDKRSQKFVDDLAGAAHVRQSRKN